MRDSDYGEPVEERRPRQITREQVRWTLIIYKIHSRPPFRTARHVQKNTSICTEKSYVNERGSALENRQQQQRERATTSSRKAPGGEARSPAGRARVIISSHRATQRKREREKVVLEQQRLDLHSRQSNQEE